MSRKFRYLFVLIGLAGASLLLMACAASPAPPTSTALPPTATPEEPTPVTTPALVLPTATPTPLPFPPTIALEQVTTGFRRPVYLTHAGDPTQVYVVEQKGLIQLVVNGQIQPTPFLDITDRVGSRASEQGLLSVAFPPDFADSHVFYVNYTDRRGDTVIARFRLSEDNPMQADPNSEQIVLQIDQPANNHNGGQLQFGPDGYLYIGMGDGGRGGDPWGNAQNLSVLLGKMLRIDVTGVETYAIPADNPFVGQDNARSEIWAWGLRNPWRFSFDRATGDLYIADVGQNRIEEVDFQPADSPGGENYGWDIMEGSACFEPPQGCDPTGLVMPVVEYDHKWGCSITGGYVYRGTQYPQLNGIYFYGDFCSGRIWGLKQTPSGEWLSAPLLEAGIQISSFGEDANGEIYVLDYSSGTVYHLVSASE